MGSAVMAVSPSFFREQVLGKDGTEPDLSGRNDPIDSHSQAEASKKSTSERATFADDKTKTKGQGSRGNVPPTNRKKVSPRKHLGLGAFELACDRAGWSTGESQKGKTYMAPIQSQEL